MSYVVTIVLLAAIADVLEMVNLQAQVRAAFEAPAALPLTTLDGVTSGVTSEHSEATPESEAPKRSS